MFLASIFIYLTIYVSEGLSIDLGPKNSESYGAYDIQFLNPEVCKGPKSKDIANMSITIEVNEKNDYLATMNLTMFGSYLMSEIRIIVSAIKGNRKNLLWNYRLKKPCEHFVVGDLIEMNFHTKTCYMKKANYSNVLNFSQFARKFFGTSFFYGNFHIKSYALSPTGNILCLIVTTVFKKKD